MDLSSPLACNLCTGAREILRDAPEPEDAMQSNGVKLVVDSLVRSAVNQGLYVEDDSTSEKDQGFIDLLLEEDSRCHNKSVASSDLNEIMRNVTGVAAANGVRCHFVLRVHVSYTPVEEA